MYLEGLGIQKETEDAVALFGLACTHGLGESCWSLGSLYERGDGVQKDADLAAEYYRKGCDDSYTHACEELARLKK